MSQEKSVEFTAGLAFEYRPPRDPAFLAKPSMYRDTKHSKFLFADMAPPPQGRVGSILGLETYFNISSTSAQLRKQSSVEREMYFQIQRESGFYGQKSPLLAPGWSDPCK